jgi:kynurenine formamidase
LGHVGIGETFYNGNTRADFSRAEGLQKLGIENVGAIVTRGVLIDVAASKGVARLDGGYEITRADNATFNSTAPGVGLDAAQGLVDREVVIVGSDNWSTEVVPNPNAELQFPVHQLLVARNGVYIFENLLTEELARDRVYEFAFFFAPLRLKGASGSPGNPLAIR